MVERLSPVHEKSSRERFGQKTSLLGEKTTGRKPIFRALARFLLPEWRFLRQWYLIRNRRSDMMHGDDGMGLWLKEGT